MGRGIAQIAALAGLKVRLFDTNPAAVGAARDYLADTFAKLTAKGKLDEFRSRAALACVSPAQRLAELADCDLVVEAIVEKLDVKRALLRELETIVSAAACWRRTHRRCRLPRLPPGAPIRRASSVITSSIRCR